MTYSCHNRGDFTKRLVVQSGWFMDGVSRTPRMVSIPFRMATSCQYQQDDKYADPQCVGCKHKDLTKGAE